MSKLEIIRFNFGESGMSSDLSNKNNKEKDPDNLILVDAFWIKDGMKIRFIPHQMKDIELIVVFSLEFDDEAHDKEHASFLLDIEIPGTKFERLSKEIKFNELQKRNYRGYVCYYYEYKEFTNIVFGQM